MRDWRVLPAIDRHEGFSRPPGHLSDGKGRRGLAAQERMDTLPARFPEIDVYAGDRMAAGVGRHAPEKEKGMRFVGTDAIPGEGYGVECAFGRIDDIYLSCSGDRDRLRWIF